MRRIHLYGVWTMQGEERWVPGGPAWEQLFSAIDGGDATAFASFVAPEGEFRFGNAPPVCGRDAVREAVAGFFHAIGGCRHRLLRSWHSAGSAACEGEVTYTRRDGSTLTLPFANVFLLHGGEIASYRIYIDNGPLFAPPAGGTEA
jgi:ketosteroid isomerase-like protein